jgi:hypothetical protein
MATEPIADDAIVQMPYKQFRRHEWMVTLYTSVGSIVTLVVVFVVFAKQEADHLREHALMYCSYGECVSCLETLDVAARLDKAGNERSDVRAARAHAQQVLAPRLIRRPP